MDGIIAAIPGATAQGLVWGVMALGVYVTYKLLDIADLTVDSSLCTGGATSAVLILMGMHPLLSLVFAVFAGMLAGLVTGFLHTRLRIPAILAGILTQLGLYSINLRIMGKSSVALLRQPVVISLGNIPMALLIGVLVAAAVVAVMYWFFGTELGCAIRATGNNRKMVRAQGVNTDTMKIIGLVLSNGLVGLAGACWRSTREAQTSIWAAAPLSSVWPVSSSARSSSARASILPISSVPSWPGL